MKTKHLFITSIILFLCAANLAWAQDPEIITLPPLTADVWASYCPSKNIRFPQKSVDFPVSVYSARYDEGLQAVVVTELNTDDTVNIGKTTMLGSYGGYLLKATITGDNYTVRQSDNYNQNVFGSNLLGTTSDTLYNARSTYDPNETYLMVLYGTTGKFVSYVGDTIPPHKAYFFVGKDIIKTTAPSIRIVEEPEVVTTLDDYAEEAKGMKILRNGQLYIRRKGVTYDLMGRTVR